MAGETARRILSLQGVRIIGILFLLATLSAPGPASAGDPTDQIRGAIDRGIAILKRPDLKAKEKREERREALRKELFPSFNFEEMAKRSLGIHWKDRTSQEREEFTRLFRTLLENAYAGKIEGYKGEKILYRKESVDLPYAEVDTVIVMLQGDEIPVDYRVLKDGARWRIYDIVIEGVSLVNNYRSQFAGILQKSSYPELVRRLKSTIQQQEKG
ncbi:MAG: ABC transporter substrate-binding protein [Candidatus Deferrimicrobium sp.]